MPVFGAIACGLKGSLAFSHSRAGYCDCETHSMKKRQQALAEMLIADGRIAWRKNRRGKHCCWHYRDLRKVSGFALPLAVGWIADESGVIVRKAAREYIHLLEEFQDGLDADNWVDSILDIAKKLRQLNGAGPRIGNTLKAKMGRHRRLR
jgi:hypothetical protein